MEKFADKQKRAVDMALDRVIDEVVYFLVARA